MPKYRSLWYPTSNMENGLLGINLEVTLESVIHSIVMRIVKYLRSL